MTLKLPKCLVLGGGGHARVLLDALIAGRLVEPVAVIESDERRWGEVLMGIPVMGGDETIREWVDRGVTGFVVAVGSVGNVEPRQRLAELGRSYGLQPVNVIHPSAVRSPFAAAGEGLQMLAGSVVNAAAMLGEHVIVNTGAIVEHDCRLGDFAHVATGARLVGGVVVGVGTHIGAGATVLERIRIGAGVMVGAGAVVVRDVPDGQVVVGVPARERKR